MYGPKFSGNMGNKRQEPQIPEELVIREAGIKGYQKGWNDRKEFDSGLIEEAINQSKNFMEFSILLKEKLEKAGEASQ